MKDKNKYSHLGFVSGDVSVSMLKDFVNLLTLSHETSLILLMFESGGGEIQYIEPIRRVINKIQEHTELIMINIGEVSSAAVPIFLACNKRGALQNTSFMIHKTEVTDLESEGRSTTNRLANEIKGLQDSDKQYLDYIYPSTKFTKKDKAVINSGKDLNVTDVKKMLTTKIINMTQKEVDDIF